MAKTLPIQVPTGNHYEYNYGQAHQTNSVLKGSGNTENIKTLPIQVPGQDFHEYSYEEALKASGALDASGNIVASTKSVAAQVPTGNQYGYNYEELLKANGVLGGSGNIKAFPTQTQTGNYYGYNYGHNLKATAGLNGYLYNNIGDVAFNKQVQTQVPHESYYTPRHGKQINVGSGISNAFLSSYGYDNTNADFVSKPIATDAYQANANKYIGLFQIAQNGVASEFVSNSAPGNYKTKQATAFVYHTNSENQKYPITGINNVFESGYEKFTNYPVPTSVPVPVSKPQNYGIESIQSSNQNLNELTQSVLEYNSHKYPLSDASQVAIQFPQTYNIDTSKPYQVNAHYTSASEAQSTSGHDAHAYIDSALQSSPVGKQQTDIHSTYGKKHKAVHELEQQIQSYQVPEIIADGPYHTLFPPVPVPINDHNIAGYNNPATNFETEKLLAQYGVNNNRAPVTFNNDAYKSDEYSYDGSDSQVYQNEDVQTGYGKDSSHYDHDVVKSSAAVNPSEYVSTGSVSNEYKSQYGGYDTNNYNSYQNAAKGNQFNEHNTSRDNSNVYNGFKSYDNQHGSEATEHLTAGFKPDSYKTNVYNQQPNGYPSNYVSGGYVIDDNSDYHSGADAASNIQTGKYEPSTYQTITNGTNGYDSGYHTNSAGYESGYESDGYSSDTYNFNGFKPIEHTNSTYGNGNQDASGYKYSSQESQGFAAYNQLTQDHKTTGQVYGNYHANQFKPYSYSTAQNQAEKILGKENGIGQSDDVHSKLNDQKSEEVKSKTTGKSHKSEKEKSGSSSAFVSVKHGDHSYSYNVKQNTK